MTDPAPPVRLAFAGCGNVAQAYLAVADRLQHAGLTTVTALHAPERHRSRAAAWRIPSFHPDYASLLARPDIDAILILTPMPHHAPMALAALQAGKHVLVEKPLATTVAEAGRLLEAARTAQRLLVCAPFTTLSPTFHAIHQRIQRGDLGRVVSARGRYGWAGPDWTDWFYKPGGGALFDLGVYNLTTLTGWLGPVRRVMAMSGIAIPERQVQGRTVRVESDDTTQVLLDWGDGRFASLTCGFTLQQYRGPGLELYGTQGTLNLLGDDWDPDGYELWQNSAGCWQLYKETQPDWPWTDGLRHLVECIRLGVPSAVTPQHALHVLDVMVQALASAREGRAMPVHSTFPPIPVQAAAEPTAAHRVHDRTRGTE